MRQHHLRFYNYAVALCLSAIAVVSCKDDAKMVVIGDESKLPSMEVLNLNVDYTEYGKTKVLLKAPTLQRFLFSEEPYSIFPNGFHVQFFTDSTVLESQITADYALYKEKPAELWKATGNVVVVNYQKQQKLYTDTLYWDRTAHSIYTGAPVRVETTDGVINGRDGLVSDEKFTNYEIRNVGESHYYFDDTPGNSTAPTETITTVSKPAPPVPEKKVVNKPVRAKQINGRRLMIDSLRKQRIMDTSLEPVR